MDEIKKLFSRIRLVRMRTPNLVKIALTIVIVACMCVLIGLRIAVIEVEKHNEALHSEAAELENANSELDKKIDALGTIQSVIDIAREELGLVEPGTVFFETVPASATQSSEGN